MSHIVQRVQQFNESNVGIKPLLTKRDECPIINNYFNCLQVISSIRSQKRLMGNQLINGKPIDYWKSNTSKNLID